jgi:hypothetical protein
MRFVGIYRIAGRVIGGFAVKLGKAFNALLLCALVTAVSADAGAAPARKAAARRAAPKAAPKAAASGIAANYARLCENGGTADEDTCAALKAALIAKLQGGSVTAEAAKPLPPKPKPGFGLTIQKSKGILVKGEVMAVEPGSPAAKLGLAVGDKLLTTKGSSLFSPQYYFSSQADLQTWLTATAGKPQTLYFEHGGKTQSAEITVDPGWADGGAGQAQTALAAQAKPANGGLLGLVGAAGAGNSGSGLNRTRTAAYGSTIAFEQRLGIGEMLEIEVAAPDGTATIPIMCFWDDGFMGSDHQTCLSPAPLAKSSEIFRFRARKKGEVHVKVKATGPQRETYSVITRGEQRGKGAEAIATLERMAGKLQIGENSTVEDLPFKMALRYTIGQRGQRGELLYRTETGETSATRYSLTDAGDLHWEHGQESGKVEVADDGAIVHFFGGGRVALTIGADGLIQRTAYPRTQYFEEDKNAELGSFLLTRTMNYAPTSEAAVAELLKKGPARMDAAKRARMAEWGGFNQLAGRSWLFSDGSADPTIATYTWNVPGYILDVRFWNASGLGLAASTAGRMAYLRDSGAISVSYSGIAGAEMMKRGALGEMVARGAGGTVTLSMTGPDQFTYRYTGPDGKPTARAPQILRPLSDNQLADMTSRAKQARVEQQRAAAEEKANSGGGFFDIVGKGLQAYAIASDPTAYRAAMVQGLNQGVPGLGSVVDAASGGGANLNNGGGIGGGGNGGGGARASFRTLGNMAKGPQCPGFTMENYRTVALNGGNDQQLFSLCGQAFEYYHQYENAIAQGYSEAEANLTYKAHEQSALVATDFYNKNKTH